MTENFDSAQSEPITDLDLAAYHSGYLSKSRHKEVGQFLQQHTEVADAAEIADAAEEEQHGRRDAAGATTVIHDQSDDGNPSGQRPNANHEFEVTGQPSLRSKSSPSRFGKLTTQVVVTTILLVSVIAAVHLVQTQAVAERLDRVQKLVEAPEGLTNHLDQEDALQALQTIGDSLFVSRSNERRRLWLLALLNFQVAEREFRAARAVNRDPQFVSAIQARYDRVTVLLDRIRPLTDKERELMILGLFERSRIMYQLGTLKERWRPEAQTFLNDAASKLLDALDLIDQSSREVKDTCEVAVAALLLRSLRKGAGQHFQDSNSALGKRLRERFPDLPAEENIAFDALGQSFLDKPYVGRRSTVGHLDLHNLIGMYLTLHPTRSEQAIPYLRTGVELADELSLSPETSEDLDFAITHGRLLGNLADAYRSLELDDLEFKSRQGAIAVLEAAFGDSPPVEISFELKWLLSRQLLLTFSNSAQKINAQHSALPLLGKLNLITKQLADFRGSQLGKWETFAVRAINAEVKVNQNQSWDPSFLDELPSRDQALTKGPGGRLLIRPLECCLKSQVIVERPEIFQQIQDFRQLLE